MKIVSKTTSSKRVTAEAEERDVPLGTYCCCLRQEQHYHGRLDLHSEFWFPGGTNPKAIY